MKGHKFLIWGLALLIIGVLGLAVVDVVVTRSARVQRFSNEFGRGRNYGLPGGAPGTGMMGPGGYMMRDFSKSSYKSDGEEIFVTGRSSSGGRVYSNFGMMRIGCANCHGADATGGLTMPDGTISPDIRWSALGKDGFTETTLKRAITEGVDEKGQPLSDYMPRWTMDSQDLSAVVAYLKTL